MRVKNQFGERLCALRKQRGVSQKQLAASLNKRGVEVTNQAVSKWESGASLPNALQFLAVCDALDITDISGAFNGRTSELFLGLNDEGRVRVAEYAAFLRDSGKYDAQDAPTPRGSRIRTLPVYGLSDSVEGRFLDRTDYESVRVGSEVPLSANFGIRVEGESMLPDFSDGEVVWIEQRAKLENGDIGVFLYEGKAYFKRLRDRVGGVRLQSQDANYPDVIIAYPEKLTAVGRVAK